MEDSAKGGLTQFENFFTVIHCWPKDVEPYKLNVKTLDLKSKLMVFQR